MADKDSRSGGERFAPSVPPQAEPYRLKGSSGLDWGMQSRLARVFQPADGRTGVPRGADVGVLEHDVTVTAHGSVRRRFRLGENIDQTVSRDRTGRIAETEPHALQCLNHR